MRAPHAIALAAVCVFAAATCAIPDAHAQLLPMSAYWSNEDGRQWLYEQHHERFVSPFDVVDNQARLFFEGTTMIAGTIPAQLLKGSIAWPPAREASALDVPEEIADPLLRNLWRARPDLQPAIFLAAAQQPCNAYAIPDWHPLLLTGGLAYVKTTSEIGAWRCNAPGFQAWLWMTSDLSPGSTAQLQLVPDLADDVILRLTVLGLVDATVPAGAFEDVLHIDYVIEYGESKCTGPGGESGGTIRSETTGFVRYAPGVGPIESFEEFANVLVSGDPCKGVPGPGTVSRSTLKLASPSVPAAVASWGQLKAAYR